MASIGGWIISLFPVNKVRNLAEGCPDITYKPRKCDGSVTNGTLVVDGGRFPGKSCFRFMGGNIKNQDAGGAPLAQEYIDVDVSGAKTFDTQELSVEFWCKPLEGDQNGASIIWKEEYGGLANWGGYARGWKFDTIYYNNELHLAFYWREENDDTGWSRSYVGGYSPLLMEKWNHVVGILSSLDGQGIIYINTIKCEVEPVPNRLFIDVDPIHIGRASSNTVPFHGYIGEVAMFNRVLSQDEVIQRYRLGKP